MAKESIPPSALVDNLVAVVSEPQLADLRELHLQLRHFSVSHSSSCILAGT